MNLTSKDIYKGEVKFFKEDKGFGFIKYDEKEIFFHISKVNGGKVLKSNEIVNFRIMPSVKGPQAIDINLEK